jgi:hypothetical protein
LFWFIAGKTYQRRGDKLQHGWPVSTSLYDAAASTRTLIGLLGLPTASTTIKLTKHCKNSSNKNAQKPKMHLHQTQTKRESKKTNKKRNFEKAKLTKNKQIP